jgi:ubiquinone biosynthesis protein UbiJ
MIKEYSLKALQKAINYALSLDEYSAQRIEALEGKVVEIILSPLEVHFFLTFEKGLLCLCQDSAIFPHTTIKSSPLGLIKLSVLPPSKARSLFNNEIEMQGEVEVGEAVKQLFDALDIDWESHIAAFTGDMVAHQLGSWMRQGLLFKKRISTSLKKNMTEYLQDECRLSPCKEELEDFFQAVEALAMDVARLEARFAERMKAL